MALELTFTDEAGVLHNDAYFHVEAINIINKGIASITMRIYSSRANKNAGKHYITSGDRLIVDNDDYDTYFSDTALSASGKSPIGNAYEHLKTFTMPFDFKNNSTDV